MSYSQILQLYKKPIYIIIIYLLIQSFTLSSSARNHQFHSLKNQANRIITTSNKNNKSCIQLNRSLRSILVDDMNNWSVTILDQNGSSIVDLNSNKLFVPASNLKLFTTAYALETLGPDFLLTTSLYKRFNGNYELVGDGDPDFNDIKIMRVVNSLQHSIDNKLFKTKSTTLILREEPKMYWWPKGWKYEDMNESYGAPITRLAISSNFSQSSLNNPLFTLKQNIRSKVGKSINNFRITHKPFKSTFANRFSYRLLHREYSAPMLALLSLANAESHNFTAEVLLRNAARSWNSELAAIQMTKWLKSKGIYTPVLRIIDGSGLSRENLLTSKSLASVLFYMTSTKLFPYYISSLAIIGQRGTLADFASSSSLNGRFFGKTGTLEGVRSLSGYLESGSGYIYISILSNGAEYPNNKIKSILSATQRYSKCH